MTVDQALQLAESLLLAVRVAVQSGQTNVSLLESLQAADDEARKDLEAVISSIKTDSSQ